MPKIIAYLAAITREKNSRMEDVTVEVSIVSRDPRDLMIQRETLDLAESLRSLQPELKTIQLGPTPDGLTAKDSAIELTNGAVKLVLPASAAALVLKAWIQEYFRSRSARRIEIKIKGGSSAIFSGYSESELGRLFPLDKSATGE